MNLATFLNMCKIDYTVNKDDSGREALYIDKNQLQLEMSVYAIANFCKNLVASDYWNASQGYVSSSGEYKFKKSDDVFTAVMIALKEFDHEWISVLFYLSKLQDSVTRENLKSDNFRTASTIESWQKNYLKPNELFSTESGFNFEKQQDVMFRCLTNLPLLPHHAEKELMAVEQLLPECQSNWLPLLGNSFTCTKYDDKFYEAMEKHVMQSRLPKEAFGKEDHLRRDIVCFENLNEGYCAYVDMTTLTVLGTIKDKTQIVSPVDLMYVARACGHCLVS